MGALEELRAMTLGQSLDLQLAGSPTLSESLSNKWRELCRRYLSVTREGSFWRYSRPRSPEDPEQGWKLHIAATVLTAHSVLEVVGPFLQSRGVMFKGPASLQDLSRLNSGVYYGYTLVGKCFTVYPQTIDDALTLAHRLHELTIGISAPAVPFDLQLKPGSCIYYRYGAFKHQQIDNGDGTYTLALRTPEGNLEPDVRQSPIARPGWVADPFLSQHSTDAEQIEDSPLKTTFRVFRAITQRGKGGVYQAVDLSTVPPRFCILKEGRRHGEPCWDGRDGYWRVKNEERVLRSLHAAQVPTPIVYSSFELEGNRYLVTEYLEGESLQALLNRRERQLSIRRALSYGLQLAGLMAQIHSDGWVWRDCKPSNLIVTKRGVLRPLDFEGACLINEPDPTPWGTPAFVPPESHKPFCGQSRIAEDLYALGVMLYHLLSGDFPATPLAIPFENIRRNVPVEVCRTVSGLLYPDPRLRPMAELVAENLKTALEVS